MKKEWIILGLVVAFLGYLVVSRPRPNVTKEGAHELVAQGALLLDVRTASEFAEKHIEGAENIPLADLGARLTELPDKSRSIVVYCRSGRRSAQAKALLEETGYENVVDLGAMGNW